VTWLVTGGAGYIGAHVVAAMRAAGEAVAVLDDLSTGDRSRVRDVPLVVGSTLDGALVGRTLRQHGVTGIVHVAAKKQVEESVRRPLFYYRENVEGLRVLLEEAVSAGVGSLVFSSSAAVYGMPDVDLVREDTDCRPVNPYGQTKLTGEHMVTDVARATGLRYACLRYFNVAGAARPELADRCEAHLVPMVFRRISERQAPLIFGDGFPTPDGTCIRDFIHVSDIASAHTAVARALGDARLDALIANVGRGDGVSVRQMVAVIREVTGTAGEAWAEPVVAPPREGDPPRVVAAADTIRDALGWAAQFGLRDMVASAWEGWSARISAVTA
jgi:UDP-glucose 4-epimerase